MLMPFALNLKGYLAHKKHPSRRTLQQPYASGPRLIVWGWAISIYRGTHTER